MCILQVHALKVAQETAQEFHATVSYVSVVNGFSVTNWLTVALDV